MWIQSNLSRDDYQSACQMYYITHLKLETLVSLDFFLKLRLCGEALLPSKGFFFKPFNHLGKDLA